VFAPPHRRLAQCCKLFPAFSQPRHVRFDALQVDWFVFEQGLEVAELAVKLAAGFLEVTVQHDLHESDDVLGKLRAVLLHECDC